MRWLSDLSWNFREWFAKKLVSLAYRFDPEIGADMYGANEAKAVCTAIALGQLEGDEAQRRAYAEAAKAECEKWMAEKGQIIRAAVEKAFSQ